MGASASRTGHGRHISKRRLFQIIDESRNYFTGSFSFQAEIGTDGAHGIVTTIDVCGSDQSFDGVGHRARGNDISLGWVLVHTFMDALSTTESTEVAIVNNALNGVVALG